MLPDTFEHTYLFTKFYYVKLLKFFDFRRNNTLFLVSNLNSLKIIDVFLSMLNTYTEQIH